MIGARLTLKPDEEHIGYVECWIHYGKFENSMVFGIHWFQLFTIQWRVWE